MTVQSVKTELQVQMELQVLMELMELQVYLVQVVRAEPLVLTV